MIQKDLKSNEYLKYIHESKRSSTQNEIKINQVEQKQSDSSDKAKHNPDINLNSEPMMGTNTNMSNKPSDKLMPPTPEKKQKKPASKELQEKRRKRAAVKFEVAQYDCIEPIPGSVAKLNTDDSDVNSENISSKSNSTDKFKNAVHTGFMRIPDHRAEKKAPVTTMEEIK